MKQTKLDPLIEELRQAGERVPCQLEAALASASVERRAAVLEAVIHGARGGRVLARVLASYGIEVRAGVLDRHRYSGCARCGIEVTR